LLSLWVTPTRRQPGAVRRRGAAVVVVVNGFACFAKLNHDFLDPCFMREMTRT
jgi:hypothetical protein